MSVAIRSHETEIELWAGRCPTLRLSDLARGGRSPRAPNPSGASAPQEAELLATGPNQACREHITYLPGPVKGQYYRLYVMLDIYRRHVMGWRGDALIWATMQGSAKAK